MVLSAMIGGDIKSGVEDLNIAIEHTAKEAWQVEVRNMRELDEMGMQLDEPKHQIRAKLGAIHTAQDILDRAGKRAPTKIQSTNFNATVPPQMMDRLTDVLEELAGGVGRGTSNRFNEKDITPSGEAREESKPF
jgi:hypothetical protein